MDRKNIVGLMVLTGFLHAICGCSDSGTSATGPTAFFYDGEFSGVSTRDMESLCSRLQKEVDALGEDSVFCGEHSADYIVYIPRRDAASLDEVLLKKTEECAEALDEWRRRCKK